MGNAVTDDSSICYAPFSPETPSFATNKSNNVKLHKAVEGFSKKCGDSSSLAFCGQVVGSREIFKKDVFRPRNTAEPVTALQAHNGLINTPIVNHETDFKGIRLNDINEVQNLLTRLSSLGDYALRKRPRPHYEQCKLPPRVSLTEGHRVQWMHDLCNREIPLKKLCKLIPHGIRNISLLKLCTSMKVPPSRAIWFIQCICLNEIKAFKKLNSTKSVSEMEWLAKWTESICQFLTTLMQQSVTKEEALKQRLNSNLENNMDHSQKAVREIKERFDSELDYGIRLVRQLITEKLIDFTAFLRWIREFLESDMGKKYRRYLLNLLKWSGVEYIPRLDLKYMLYSLQYSDHSVWKRRRNYLRQNIALQYSQFDKSFPLRSIRLRILEFLESYEMFSDLRQLLKKMKRYGSLDIQTRTIINWATSPFNLRYAKIMIAAELLQLMAIKENIMDLVSHFNEPQNDIFLCAELLSELIVRGIYSPNRYMSYLISWGIDITEKISANQIVMRQRSILMNCYPFWRDSKLNFIAETLASNLNNPEMDIMDVLNSDNCIYGISSIEFGHRIDDSVDLFWEKIIKLADIEMAILEALAGLKFTCGFRILLKFAEKILKEEKFKLNKLLHFSLSCILWDLMEVSAFLEQRNIVANLKMCIDARNRLAKDITSHLSPFTESYNDLRIDTSTKIFMHHFQIYLWRQKFEELGIETSMLDELRQKIKSCENETYIAKAWEKVIIKFDDKTVKKITSLLFLFDFGGVNPHSNKDVFWKEFYESLTKFKMLFVKNAVYSKREESKQQLSQNMFTNTLISKTLLSRLIDLWMLKNAEITFPPASQNEMKYFIQTIGSKLYTESSDNLSLSEKYLKLSHYCCTPVRFIAAYLILSEVLAAEGQCNETEFFKIKMMNMQLDDCYCFHDDIVELIDSLKSKRHTDRKNLLTQIVDNLRHFRESILARSNDQSNKFYKYKLKSGNRFHRLKVIENRSKEFRKLGQFWTIIWQQNFEEKSSTTISLPASFMFFDASNKCTWLFD